MKEEKAPGVDGIPIEVYKTFWPYLKDTLLEIYNETLELGTLTKTQKTSAVSVLHKGGERSEIRNYRPISLLCADYKILAKILTNRITHPRTNN